MDTSIALRRPRIKSKQHPDDRALEAVLRDIRSAIDRGDVQPHHTALLVTRLTGRRRRDAAKLILALPDRHFISVMDRISERPKISAALEFALLQRAARLGALHRHLAMESLAFAAGQNDPETFRRVFEIARSYRDTNPQLFAILNFDSMLFAMIEMALGTQEAQIVARHLEEQPEDLRRAFQHLRRMGRLKHSQKPVLALLILENCEVRELLKQQLKAVYRDHPTWAHLFDDTRHAELSRHRLAHQFSLAELLTLRLRDIRKRISA